MEITVRQAQARVPVTIVQPHGEMDASNYKSLIAKVQEVYTAGGRDLLLDLSDVSYMSSSGLVALHSIARIMRAEQPPDLESGWEALHAIDRERDQLPQRHVKLLSPQPEIDSLLGTVGFKAFFQVFTDQAAALASF